MDDDAKKDDHSDYAVDLMAALLVESVKAKKLRAITVPVLDDSSVWEVIVRNMGIQE
jgi:hypothetical protein